ncbi:hypothetical protein Mapa_007956 [Marchantia paleacea]|nr:hypothetical protein Mapa_007956 [Marchantia paleacea]
MPKMLIFLNDLGLAAFVVNAASVIQIGAQITTSSGEDYLTVTETNTEAIANKLSGI